MLTPYRVNGFTGLVDVPTVGSRITITVPKVGPVSLVRGEDGVLVPPPPVREPEPEVVWRGARGDAGLLTTDLDDPRPAIGVSTVYEDLEGLWVDTGRHVSCRASGREHQRPSRW